ncbi:hypothetical protein K503DRAFT_770922 [Rhizopogon vinicolor AM-OR11-026]|uniref:Uncharacterized protein n=1 Tax=Rhizopogon vinicolor AM-OR11-026 TaxID=1314800 RepID=A0A1B7MZJ7_9AGAM|nr:hypothetical protein K503DRAFT_770922 [Rhizopogon vinicolor AM-OR11-026]
MGKLDTVRAAMKPRPPYCCGTLPVTPERCVLFYSTGLDDHAGKINLLSATSEELDHFTRSCRAQAPTTNEDFRSMPVQLNATEIATTFNAEHYRLTDVIQNELLEGGNDKRPLQLLAQDLKVYDTGCHERSLTPVPATDDDTARQPGLLDACLHEYRLLKRSEDSRMFSLSLSEFCEVSGISFEDACQFESSESHAREDTTTQKGFATILVVFPTYAEGGALLLRQRHHEWNIDFAELFASTADVSVAFVAFYDDVRCGISTVTSGHRMILTYRLQFPTGNDIPLATLDQNGAYDVNSLKTGITELLLDPNILPGGGYLAFGIHNQYTTTSRSVVSVGSHLKGRDAVIARALSALSIPWSVRILYRNVGWTEFSFLTDHIIDLSSHGEVHDLMGTLGNPEIVYFVRERGEPDRKRVKLDEDVVGKDATDIMLVSTRPSAWSMHTQYVAGGGEVMMGNLYGDVCIIAERPLIANEEEGSDSEKVESTT